MINGINVGDVMWISNNGLVAKVVVCKLQPSAAYGFIDVDEVDLKCRHLTVNCISLFKSEDAAISCALTWLYKKMSDCSVKIKALIDIKKGSNVKEEEEEEVKD